MCMLRKPTTISQLSFLMTCYVGNACTFLNNLQPRNGSLYTTSHMLHKLLNQGYAVQYGATNTHLAYGHYFYMKFATLGINVTGGCIKFTCSLQSTYANASTPRVYSSMNKELYFGSRAFASHANLSIVHASATFYISTNNSSFNYH